MLSMRKFGFSSPQPALLETHACGILTDKQQQQQAAATAGSSSRQQQPQGLLTDTLGHLSRPMLTVKLLTPAYLSGLHHSFLLLLLLLLLLFSHAQVMLLLRSTWLLCPPT